MRRAFTALVLCLTPLGCGAAQLTAGRWEGTIQIPGRELRLIVDLARDSAGAWSGSIIIPGLGIKGAPLSSIVVAPGDIAFDTGSLLVSSTYGPARFKANLGAGEGITGEMSQGGNTAPFRLQKTGAAQVELPPRSTPVRHEIEAEWKGDFELGGYPRHVTITLENHPGSAATATFVVVGKQTTNLPVDLVVEDGEFLRIESLANHVLFEGRIRNEKDEIGGTIELGPFELPLSLRRSTRKAT